MQLDIFNNDAFRVQQLSLALNDLPLIPGRLGELGYFTERGIATTSISVERVGQAIKLVDARPRGAPGTPVSGNKRKAISINAVHLPESGGVIADEVQNLRAFGTDSELVTVQALVNDKLAIMKRNIDVTMEWQRIGALRGQVLDADGTTVLIDMFTTFGLSQTTVNFNLSSTTASISVATVQMKRQMEAIMGGTPFKSIRVLCSASFFDALVTNTTVVNAWYLYNQSEFLRTDNRKGFYFAGVYWEEYVGSVNGQAFIPDGEAIAVPEGVADLFTTFYAPADYLETVNTIGLPYYAKQEPMRMGRGIELEAQSNPIMVNSRPNAVFRITKT